MKKSFKRFTTLSVALGMLLSSIPALPTRAATVIGSLNGKNYTDLIPTKAPTLPMGFSAYL